VTVLGLVAEMERKFIRERQQAGIEAAKAKGVYKGRTPTARQWVCAFSPRPFRRYRS
jgi:DNA invertase Pin-like site-specific DNA recombinase